MANLAHWTRNLFKRSLLFSPKARMDLEAARELIRIALFFREEAEEAILTLIDTYDHEDLLLLMPSDWKANDEILNHWKRWYERELH